MNSESYFVGVDVGTGSARAALFDARGKRLGLAVHRILLFRPEEDFAEHSSDDIWAAVARVVRQAVSEAGVAPAQIAGLGFDATCSLVALDERDRPVSVSPTGKDEQNVIVWMDHRAILEAERINRTKHPVLAYVGGAISPEMQTPKLLWLKEHLPSRYHRVARFLDLPDFLSYRATGVDTRSLCTTVCKWTYLGHEQRWDDSFFRAVGLEDHAGDSYRRIGTRVRPMGECVGALTPQAAAELGLTTSTKVAVSIIDAHAGGLGLLGLPLDGALDFDTRLALIGGTSSCHMAVSPEPRFITGIWGPYHSAMVPGLWLTEGGQSATGALIDHIIDSHARGNELRAEAQKRATYATTLLNERIDELANGLPFYALLCEQLHVYPDFHGNRSPLADPSLRGMISGLRLSDTLDSLALLYLATVQAVAHGTRDIVAAMNERGYRIDTLIACGGDTKNPLFVAEHADITGCRIAMPHEPEAVLLGAAMLAAVASGAYDKLESAMERMNNAERVVAPRPTTRAFHDRKHAVHKRMFEDQRAYRTLMSSEP
jgi:FGGY-family pentulose kinase